MAGPVGAAVSMAAPEAADRQVPDGHHRAAGHGQGDAQPVRPAPRRCLGGQGQAPAAAAG
jgi:hypothetical protein